ncbi:Highly acidic protein [hydrothermal vent metagenome]|uniref:Highly acidic protein n=1 Tax=hydrothermal vent metagenome TaxID=652676 RepID=A0A1W1CWZ6_9ZZZZ
MKILLLNNNPVVNKLVTLSAQKTSDELDIAANVEDIEGSSYDLVVVDDSIGGDEVLEILREKVHFVKSLYICTRDAKVAVDFNSILKKPFLPTDLVELFAMFGKEIKEGLTAQSTQNLQDEIDDLEEFSLDETVDLDIDELELDINDSDELLSESVLDDEEAQKVKDLLDETEATQEEAFDFDMALDLEDEADVDIGGEDTLDEIEDMQFDELDDIEDSNEKKDEAVVEDDAFDFDMALDLEDEADVDLAEDDAIEDMQDEEENFEELEDAEEVSDITGLEQQIQEAVEDLSQEDLESELDDETLLEIAASEMDSLDKLSSKDLKLALGEELNEEELQSEEDVTPEDVAELLDEAEEDVQEEALEHGAEGIVALKKLLKALDDKDVAASMQGMKITITIELGGQL